MENQSSGAPPPDKSVSIDALISNIKKGIPVARLKQSITPDSAKAVAANGYSALAYCFKDEALGPKHRLDVAEVLLRAGADPNIKIDGNPLFHKICRVPHSGWIKLMLKYGADHTYQDSQGSTPLMIVCTSGHGGQDLENIIKDFAAAGADFQTSNDGFPSLWDALGTTQSRFELLLDLHSKSIMPDPPGGLKPWVLSYIRSRSESNWEITARNPIWKVLDTDTLLSHLEELVGLENVSKSPVIIANILEWSQTDLIKSATQAQMAQAVRLVAVAGLRYCSMQFSSFSWIKWALERYPDLKSDGETIPHVCRAVQEAWDKKNMNSVIFWDFLSILDILADVDLKSFDPNHRPIPLKSFLKLSHQIQPTSSSSPIASGDAMWIHTPVDALMEILSRCESATDVVSFACTCKALNATIKSAPDSFWKRIFKAYRIELTSNDNLQQNFASEVRRRRQFRQWSPVKDAAFELPFAPDSPTIDHIAGASDSFLLGGETPVCAVFSAAKNEILQQWSSADLEADSKWVDTALSHDGKTVFMISKTESEAAVLQIAEIGSESPFQSRISLSALQKLDPVPSYASCLKHVSSSASSTRLIISPGIIFDINGGAIDHVGTLKLPPKVYVSPDGELLDIDVAMGLGDLNSWSRFAIHESNPDEIITQFYRQLWLHDIRASWDPVYVFPELPRNKYAPGGGSAPVFKDERTFWYTDPKADLIEIDLRMPKQRIVANLLLDMTDKIWEIDTFYGPSLSFFSALDPVRSRAVTSVIGDKHASWYRWDLSGPVPEFGMFMVDRPDSHLRNSYRCAAISAGHFTMCTDRESNTVRNFEF